MLLVVLVGLCLPIAGNGWILTKKEMLEDAERGRNVVMDPDGHNGGKHYGQDSGWQFCKPGTFVYKYEFHIDIPDMFAFYCKSIVGTIADDELHVFEGNYKGYEHKTYTVTSKYFLIGTYQLHKAAGIVGDELEKFIVGIQRGKTKEGWMDLMIPTKFYVPEDGESYSFTEFSEKYSGKYWNRDYIRCPEKKWMCGMKYYSKKEIDEGGCSGPGTGCGEDVPYWYLTEIDHYCCDIYFDCDDTMLYTNHTIEWDIERRYDSAGDSTLKTLKCDQYTESKSNIGTITKKHQFGLDVTAGLGAADKKAGLMQAVAKYNYEHTETWQTIIQNSQSKQNCTEIVRQTQPGYRYIYIQFFIGCLDFKVSDAGMEVLQIQTPDSVIGQNMAHSGWTFLQFFSEADIGEHNDTSEMQTGSLSPAIVVQARIGSKFSKPNSKYIMGYNTTDVAFRAVLSVDVATDGFQDRFKEEGVELLSERLTVTGLFQKLALKNEKWYAKYNGSHRRGLVYQLIAKLSPDFDRNIFEVFADSFKIIELPKEDTTCVPWDEMRPLPDYKKGGNVVFVNRNSNKPLEVRFRRKCGFNVDSNDPGNAALELPGNNGGLNAIIQNVKQKFVGFYSGKTKTNWNFIADGRWSAENETEDTLEIGLGRRFVLFELVGYCGPYTYIHDQLYYRIEQESDRECLGSFGFDKLTCPTIENGYVIPQNKTEGVLSCIAIDYFREIQPAVPIVNSATNESTWILSIPRVGVMAKGSTPGDTVPKEVLRALHKQMIKLGETARSFNWTRYGVDNYEGVIGSTEIKLGLPPKTASRFYQVIGDCGKHLVYTRLVAGFYYEFDEVYGTGDCIGGIFPLDDCDGGKLGEQEADVDNVIFS